MGDASRSSFPPSSSFPPPSSSSSSSHLALPGFHDFSAFARSHPDPGVGPSRSRPPPFDHRNQHFMSQVNAAHASTNGGTADPASHHHDHHPPPMTGDPAFDILDWYPAYQSCQRYFLDVAQHEPGTQALCALINIRLPFQYLAHPIPSSNPAQQPSDSNRSPSTNPGPSSASANSTYQFSFPQVQPPPGNLPSPSRSRAPSNPAAPFISLLPYLRRLTITGFDKPAILHGFFGDDYVRGVLPHLDCERRNYLFAAKHGGWRTCKRQYDVGSGMGEDETVPFMKPLDGAREEELSAAEKAWSQWLAMEDWMVGPHAPGEGEKRGSGVGGGMEMGRDGERGMDDAGGDAYGHDR